jgi:heme oxygenase
MPVYVNEWQNKVKQDSCTDKTVKRQDADIYVNEWQNKVKQDSCTDKTVKRQDAGICK